MLVTQQRFELAGGQRAAEVTLIPATAVTTSFFRRLRPGG
jgi:hypothetical protein